MQTALRTLLEVRDEGGLRGGEFGVGWAGAEECAGDFAIGGEVLGGLVRDIAGMKLL